MYYNLLGLNMMQIICEKKNQAIQSSPCVRKNPPKTIWARRRVLARQSLFLETRTAQQSLQIHKTISQAGGQFYLIETSI